jgi:hypothetical protein
MAAAGLVRLSKQVGKLPGRVGSAMACNFLPCDRDQAILLPPDLRDWLPADHLAWFVLDVVEQLDLHPFLAAYRADGHGRAAYQPRMLLGCCCMPTAPGSAPPTRSSGKDRKTSPSVSWPATARPIM